MNTQIGDKTTITIPNGVRFPAIVVGHETEEDFVLRSGDKIKVTRVDVISYRTQRDNPDESYLYYSNETVMFGYKPQMHPRFSTVVGLDATPEGAKIGLQEIIDAQAAQYSEFLAGRAASRSAVTSADDL